MRHIPDLDMLENSSPMISSLHRSRFHEQFTSTSSLRDPEQTTNTPPPPAGVPCRIMNRLRLERRRRKGRRHKRSLSCGLKCKTGTLNVFGIGKRVCKSTPVVGAKPRRSSNGKKISINVPGAEEQCCSSTIEKAHAHDLAKRARGSMEKKERKRQRTRFKGTIWGYDPTAGRLLSQEVECSGLDCNNTNLETCGTTNQDTSVGFYIFRGASCNGQGQAEYGDEEVDQLGRRTGKSWMYGSRWGIESGGPSRPTCPSNIGVQKEQDRGKVRWRAIGLARGKSTRSNRTFWGVARTPVTSQDSDVK